MWFESIFNSLFINVRSLGSCYSGTAFGAAQNERVVNAAVHSTLAIKFDLGFPSTCSRFWELLIASHCLATPTTSASGKLEDLCRDSSYPWDRRCRAGANVSTQNQPRAVSADCRVLVFQSRTI